MLIMQIRSKTEEGFSGEVKEGSRFKLIQFRDDESDVIVARGRRVSFCTIRRNEILMGFPLLGLLDRRGRNAQSSISQFSPKEGIFEKGSPLITSNLDPISMVDWLDTFLECEFRRDRTFWFYVSMDPNVRGWDFAQNSPDISSMYLLSVLLCPPKAIFEVIEQTQPNYAIGQILPLMDYESASTQFASLVTIHSSGGGLAPGGSGSMGLRFLWSTRAGGSSPLTWGRWFLSMLSNGSGERARFVLGECDVVLTSLENSPLRLLVVEDDYLRRRLFPTTLVGRDERQGIVDSQQESAFEQKSNSAKEGGWNLASVIDGSSSLSALLAGELTNSSSKSWFARVIVRIYLLMSTECQPDNHLFDFWIKIKQFRLPHPNPLVDWKQKSLSLAAWLIILRLGLSFSEIFLELFMRDKKVYQVE
ncbi:hypothetical protein Tco_1492486 [Tanacetum coccineum]